MTTTEQRPVCPQRGKHTFSLPRIEKWLVIQRKLEPLGKNSHSFLLSHIQTDTNAIFTSYLSVCVKERLFFLLFKANFLILSFYFVCFQLLSHILRFSNFPLFRLSTLSIRICCIDIFVNYEITSVTMKKTSFLI